MTVRVAFDFISPYAYLGWKRAQRELVGPGLVLQPLPVLFAAFLNANDTKGPAEIPSKRLYTWKHVLRLAHDQGVPIAPGLPGRSLVEQTQTSAVKQRVKDNTAEALALGVFGVPSFIVGDEVFWGQDSLPHVLAHLRGEDPVVPARLQQWADLPSTSVR